MYQVSRLPPKRDRSPKRVNGLLLIGHTQEKWWLVEIPRLCVSVDVCMEAFSLSPLPRKMASKFVSEGVVC